MLSKSPPSIFLFFETVCGTQPCEVTGKRKSSTKQIEGPQKNRSANTSHTRTSEGKRRGVIWALQLSRPHQQRTDHGKVVGQGKLRCLHFQFVSRNSQTNVSLIVPETNVSLMSLSHQIHVSRAKKSKNTHGMRATIPARPWGGAVPAPGGAAPPAAGFAGPVGQSKAY